MMKLDPIKILKAIKHIRPKAEVTLVEDDLDSLNWIVIDGNIPSHDEILQAIPVIEKQLQDDAKSVQDNRSRALQKLKALGLTEDEITALL